MSRAKLFIENFLVYGFGGVISKVIPLIMVPIITRLFPNSFYYGLSDLSTTIVSLFSALAVMGMYDAMYRMFFEKDDEQYKKDICSSAFFFTIITSTVVTLIMIALQTPISQLFYSDKQYGNLVMLSAASVLIGGTNSIISAPTRMQNKRGVYLVTNTLSPIISYSIAIPLILNGHYLIALPLANLISAFTLEIAFGVMNHKWFSFKRINWKYIQSMLKIALPLLPNFIIYWIFNSSDRVMISNILGADQEGVYAVGAKIGHISQLIYTAFAGGWQYFAFSVMKNKDNTQVVSKVFEILALASFTTTLLGTSICKWGTELLFEEEYWGAYLTIPYLYLAPLFLMLFQIGTNQFLVIKKTWPNLIILSAGAILNIVLNFVLIPKIGIEGASIATLVGYILSITLCVIVLLKMKLLVMPWRLLVAIGLFAALFVVMRLNAFSVYYVNIPLAIVYIAVLVILYWKDIKGLKQRMKNRKNKGNDDTDATPTDEKGDMNVEEATDEKDLNAVESSDKKIVYTASAKPNKNIAVQGLRGIAILLIIISHCNIFMNENGSNILQYFGAFGVSIFIILSGYLNTKKYYDVPLTAKGVLRDYKRKFLKFYPLHILTLLVALHFIVKGFTTDLVNNIIGIVANLFLVQAFIPYRSVYFSLNAVSWYLSLTVFFILLTPFIVKLVKEMPLIAKIIYAVALVVVQFVVALFFSGSSYAHWYIYICPFVRIFEYALGIMLFDVLKTKSKIIRGGGYILSLAILLLSIGVLTPSALFEHNVFLTAVWTVPAVAAVFIAVQLDNRIISLLLKNKVMVFIGNISFELFLIHQLSIRYCMALFTHFGINMPWLYCLIAVVLAVIASAIYQKLEALVKGRFMNKKLQMRNWGDGER